MHLKDFFFAFVCRLNTFPYLCTDQASLSWQGGSNDLNGILRLNTLFARTVRTAKGKKAFSDCTALREVEITSEKLTKIGYGAFSGCTGLEKVKVGNNVTVMNTAATVDTISFAFVGCDFEKLTFYTPAGSYFESQLLRIGGLKIVNY